MVRLNKIFSSFKLKLALAFVLVILVVLTSVYFVVNHFAEMEFRDYVIKGNIARATGMRSALLNYYSKNGSWKEVGQLFKDPRGAETGGYGREKGSGRPETSGGARNLVLVNREDRVVAGYNEELVGEKVPTKIQEKGLQLSYEGEEIGTLLAGPLPSTGFNQPEQQFLNSLKRAILYAGIAGLSIALVLGGLLVGQLTRPLNKLTEATKKISSGNLDQQVNIHSDDELGRLGESFNQMARSLEESEETKKRMISDIAHELRTPLSILSGEIEAIREGIYEPTEEKLEDIQDDIGLLNRLVEDLRELTLVDTGEVNLNREPTNLADVVRKVTGGMEGVLNQNNIELNLQMPDTLPEVKVDPDRISQVLNNLLKNSLRHTPRGGEIKVRVNDRSKDLLVEVSDTGEGIPSDKIDHIFERFYRVDNSRSTREGSGLGLSIAKELVNVHGGEIWVDSEEGKGTTIGFTLPKSTEGKNS